MSTAARMTREEFCDCIKERLGCASDHTIEMLTLKNLASNSIAKKQYIAEPLEGMFLVVHSHTVFNPDKYTGEYRYQCIDGKEVVTDKGGDDTYQIAAHLPINVFDRASIRLEDARGLAHEIADIFKDPHTPGREIATHPLVNIEGGVPMPDSLQLLWEETLPENLQIAAAELQKVIDEANTMIDIEGENNA